MVRIVYYMYMLLLRAVPIVLVLYSIISISVIYVLLLSLMTKLNDVHLRLSLECVRAIQRYSPASTANWNFRLGIAER